jgi:hypothetical protein
MGIGIRSWAVCHSERARDLVFARSIDAACKQQITPSSLRDPSE